MNKIFFNGQIIPANDFRLDPSDRGLLLGDGLFETMRTYKGKVLFIADHWQRLCAGAKVLQLHLSFDITELTTAIEQIIIANALQRQEIILRLTITRGPGSRGLLPSPNSQPTVMLTAMPFIPFDKKAFTVHSSDIRRNEYSPLANIKSLNYLDNILARQQAQYHHADEALLLNTHGHIAGASAANLFMITDKTLFTPRLQDGALPGIMRGKVLLLAQQINIVVKEDKITVDDLLQADEAFLTNSLLGIMPVIRVNQRVITQDQIGGITRRLTKALQEYSVRK